MGKRSYGEACGIPRALDRIGERWALMVVRELLLGPKRFTDLREGLPHMSADVLAQRLRELEENGIVERRILPPPAASKVYALTEWGRELEGVLIALGRWGARAPLAAECSEMSLDSHIVSLQTLFDPELAATSPRSSSCASRTMSSTSSPPTAASRPSAAQPPSRTSSSPPTRAR